MELEELPKSIDKVPAEGDQFSVPLDMIVPVATKLAVLLNAAVPPYEMVEPLEYEFTSVNGST
jgi:hypothetical protein